MTEQKVTEHVQGLSHSSGKEVNEGNTRKAGRIGCGKS